MTLACGCSALVAIGDESGARKQSLLRHDRPIALLPGLVYSRIDGSRDGAYLHSYGDQISIHGADAFALIERLSPYLQGDHSADTITSAIPGDKSARVAALLDELWANGALCYGPVRATTPEEHELLRPFGLIVDFIQRFTGDGLARFASYRGLAIACIGDGALLWSTVQALAQTGLHHITAAPLDGNADDARVRLDDVRDRLPAEMPAPALCFATPQDALSQASALVYAASELDVSGMLDVQRRCVARGALFLPAVIDGAHALTGPVVRCRHAPCCECSRRRLRRSREQGPPPSRLMVSAVAHHAAWTLLREVTGAMPAASKEPYGVAEVTEFAFETWVAKPRRVMAHPLCGSCAAPGIKPRPGAACGAANAERPAPAPWNAQAFALTDETFGALALEDQDADQLEMSQVIVRPVPARGHLAAPVQPVVIVGPPGPRTRAEALRRGLEAHVATLDAHHLPRMRWGERPFASLLGARDAAGDDDVVAAEQLDGAVVCLPASLRPRGSTLAVGVGSGFSRAEAIVRAALQGVAEKSLPTSPKRRSVADAAGVELHPAVRAFFERHGGVPRVVVDECDGPLVVATTHCGQRDLPAVRAYHFDAQRAIERALLRHAARDIARIEHAWGVEADVPPELFDAWLETLRCLEPTACVVDLDPVGRYVGLLPHIVALVWSPEPRMKGTR